LRERRAQWHRPADPSRPEPRRHDMIMNPKCRSPTISGQKTGRMIKTEICVVGSGFGLSRRRQAHGRRAELSVGSLATRRVGTAESDHARRDHSAQQCRDGPGAGRQEVSCHLVCAGGHSHVTNSQIIVSRPDQIESAAGYLSTLEGVSALRVDRVPCRRRRPRGRVRLRLVLLLSPAAGNATVSAREHVTREASVDALGHAWHRGESAAEQDAKLAKSARACLEHAGA
jgi:hypothetical protein